MEKPFVRRLRVYGYLAASRFPKSRAEIGERFGVSARTAARDVLDLITIGFEIEERHVANNETVYFVRQGAPLPAGFDDLTCPCRRGGPERRAGGAR